MTEVQTRGQVMAADISALLRARNPLIWVVTREEARVERLLFEASVAAGYVPRTWDTAQGVADISGKVTNADAQDVGSVLTLIGERAKGNERGIWIMRDLPAWLDGPIGITSMRQLRNLCRSLPGAPRESAQAIIILSPKSDIPAELAGHATVIDWPMPDRAEIAAILDAAIESLPDELRDNAAPNGQRDAAIDAAVGLTGEEAQACYARSLVQLRKIDPALVASEKKRVVSRERILEWYDPIKGGLDAVGGLGNLKTWLVSRKQAYSPKARAYGLPAPKGAMLVGIAGCGKSLTAKAIATAWGVPLLKVDLGALKSKFVGDSEANLRKVFKLIEAIGRCVVWFDEVEKSLQGATSGSADGGVSSDALGAVLTWMQERQGEAFVIATANDVSALPPELLRKGRFDEVWFVDLPTASERAAVLLTALWNHGRGDIKVDAAKVAKATENFTGSEIAALVPDALFAAFADGEREITTQDLIDAAATVVPLSKTAAEKITALRSWAAERARPASAPEAFETKRTVRALDL
jgi:ATPase family associated with various cellular activities (AAA)/AAA+ lid domain